LVGGAGAPSAFSAPASLAAYGKLTAAERDALTAGLAELHGRMVGRRIGYARRTTDEAYERALLALRLTIALDGVARDLLRGDQAGLMYTREAAIADTVEWILRRADRIVLAAHNGHIQRWPGTLPGMPPVTTMGLQLADRLGDDYLVIGTTTGTGQTLTMGPDFYTGRLFTDLEPPRQGSLDALMQASGDGPFAVDLRRLPAADAETVRAAGQQRFGSFYADIDPLTAYDVIVHLPRVMAAEPDPTALACSPPEVQEAFARWAAS
jgi:erythromycin esterase